MSGKKFSLTVIVITSILLVITAAVNVVIDPLFQYHKPWFGMQPVISNERYQIAGMIKSFDFDNAILGTSLSENFKVSEVNDTFGGDSAKLTMYGTSVYNMTYLLDLINKKEKKPKVLLCDINNNLLDSPSDTIKYNMPEYLYNSNPLDDAEYLWNFSVINQFTIPMIMANRNGYKCDYDSVFMWDYSNYSGKESILKYYTRVPKNGEKPNLKNTIKMSKENLDLLKKYIREMPESKFVFHVSPYSLLYWDGPARVKGLSEYKLYYQAVIEELVDFKNVNIYFWTDDEMFEIMGDLNNYVDICHYNAPINSEMLRRIKQKKGLINPENYKSELDVFFNKLENYDYDSLFV